MAAERLSHSASEELYSELLHKVLEPEDRDFAYVWDQSRYRNQNGWRARIFRPAKSEH